MRTIHLMDGLRLRFRGRDSEFNEGFEIGMISALMSLGLPEFSRLLSPDSLEQARCVAAKLGYHLAEEQEGTEAVRVTFRAGRAKPRLRLVHSRDEAPIQSAAE